MVVDFKPFHLSKIMNTYWHYMVCAVHRIYPLGHYPPYQWKEEEKWGYICICICRLPHHYTFLTVSHINRHIWYVYSTYTLCYILFYTTWNNRSINNLKLMKPDKGFLTSVRVSFEMCSVFAEDIALCALPHNSRYCTYTYKYVFICALYIAW